METLLSPAIAALLARIESEDGVLPDSTTLPPSVGREQTHRVHQRWRERMPAVAKVEDFYLPTADGLSSMRCRRIDPPDIRSHAAIMFIHGGGWTFCDIDTHEDAMRRLALATSMPVFSCDYRLAPEYPFPAGFLDCQVFWRSLASGNLSDATSFDRLVLAGDSAGANLAIALMLAELDQSKADTTNRPADAGLLVYGAYNVNFDTPSYHQFCNGPGLSREKMRCFWDRYGIQDHCHDYRAVPLQATDQQLNCLPPLTIVAAEIDPLFSDSQQLVNRLRGLGRRQDLMLLRGLVHGSLQMGGWLPEIDDAIKTMGRELKRQLP